MQTRTILSALVVAGLACVFSNPLTAQNEREIENARKRVKTLTNQAEELMQRGRVNQAERLRKQAKELQAKVDRAQKAQKAKKQSHRHEAGAHQDGSDDYHGLFHHLEHAIEALQKLGMKDHAHKLQGHAKQLHGVLAERLRKREGGRGERRESGVNHERLRWELNVFRTAKKMYAEIKNVRALEMIEKSMHAREMMLAGRRDEKATKVQHAQPKWGAEVELLNYAALHYRNHKAPDRAAALTKLAQQIAARNKKDGKKQRTEREVAMEQLELMGLAAGALKKAGQAEAAVSMNRAALALKMRLAGRRDKEAQQVYERAPDRRANAVHLGMAAEILGAKGDKRRAKLVGDLSKQFLATAKRKRGEERRDSSESQRRVQELERRMVELEKLLRELEANKKRKRSDN